MRIKSGDLFKLSWIDENKEIQSDTILALSDTSVSYLSQSLRATQITIDAIVFSETHNNPYVSGRLHVHETIFSANRRLIFFSYDGIFAEPVGIHMFDRPMQSSREGA